MNHVSTLWAVDFLHAYKLYVQRKYMIAESTLAIENPRELVILILQFNPELVSYERGSAQTFKRHLLRSCLSDDCGRIMSYDADSIRRVYDQLKKELFVRVSVVSPLWLPYVKAHKDNECRYHRESVMALYGYEKPL